MYAHKNTVPLHVSFLKNLTPSAVSLNASSKPVEKTKRIQPKFFVATIIILGEKEKCIGFDNMHSMRVLRK